MIQQQISRASTPSLLLELTAIAANAHRHCREGGNLLGTLMRVKSGRMFWEVLASARMTGNGRENDGGVSVQIAGERENHGEKKGVKIDAILQNVKSRYFGV